MRTTAFPGVGGQYAVQSGAPARISQLLDEVKVALVSEPAAFGGPGGSLADQLVDIRAAVSVRVGSAVVRLNQAGFKQSDRLYQIRDELAAGQPIDSDAIGWLDQTIAAHGTRTN